VARELKLELDEPLPQIANAVSAAGGRAYVVGGFVRDQLLRIPSKDIDVEVFGLTSEALDAILEDFGTVIHVGRAFGVRRLKELDADFSLPRADSKVGSGHRGFQVDSDPSMSLPEAARRRDLTINSLAYDLHTGELHDPFGGLEDLDKSILRASDPEHFSEDPLRGLRVAQFAARFDMVPDEELKALCRGLDLSELSAERVWAELEKILLQAQRPSVAFRFLLETDLLHFLPEIQALVGVPQDAEWHPEGDVFVHTMMVIDEAARLRSGDAFDLSLMYGALCHDLGKPATTEVVDGRTRSRKHDAVGVGLSDALLERLRAPASLVRRVGVLVRHHLAPGLYYRGGAKPKAYRKLARELEACDATMELLLRVATADHLGRTTPDAIARRFPGGDHFRSQMESLDIEEEGPKDVVLGRHLIALGLRPGKHFGDILARCRDIQDDTGWDDPKRILERVQSEGYFP